MTLNRMGQTFAVAAACVVMVLAQTASAESRTASVISDIQLAQSGTLQGQVVNREGKAVARTEVNLLQGDTAVARTTTDERGNFSFARLNTGVYSLEAAGSTSLHRVWSAAVAPPSARPGVLIVSDTQAVRGQVAGLAGLGGLGGVAAASAVIAGGYYLVDEVINDDDPPASN